MISAILFDFGGTLDADGVHWLDRFYRIYGALGLADPLSKEAIKEAFYWAERQAERDVGIRNSDFRGMVERHVRWQFQKLGLKNAEKEAEAVASFVRPAERILHRNRHVLETLSYTGFKLGVVSNNYGNLETLCREFGYYHLLKSMIDSTRIGLRKPDLRIFQRALQDLGVTAANAAFVGDSLERDVRPAKQLGMRAIWLHAEVCQQMSEAPVDGILRSLEELPDFLKRLGAASRVRA